ncbi:MAG: hypothetical protein ACRDD1_13665, partial [Planctomycetia bacterium]
MERRLGQRQNRRRKHFTLHQILKMRPYLIRLVADLRAVCVRRHFLEKLAAEPRGRVQPDYEQRRRRYEAAAELV